MATQHVEVNLCQSSAKFESYSFILPNAQEYNTTHIVKDWCKALSTNGTSYARKPVGSGRLLEKEFLRESGS